MFLRNPRFLGLKFPDMSSPMTLEKRYARKMQRAHALPFAGESEIDQLFVIQKVLGPLTPEQMKTFQRNPRFVGLAFPPMSRPERLEKRYARKMAARTQALPFLENVLQMEPLRRLSFQEALKHPYFEGLS